MMGFGYRRTWVLAIALVLPIQSPAQMTREVADRYFALTFAQQYDELLDLYATEAVFFDPTGEVFQGPVADGPVEGAATIVAMQKSWGLAGSEFDVAGSFAVGRHALYRGTLRVRYATSDPWIEFPFVTVVRVDEGRVSGRTDFAEYIESFSLGDRFAAATTTTRDVAERYLRAYLESDFESQEALLAPDATFQDPTAQVYGPNSGQPLEGAAQILARRRVTFANVSEFDLEVDDSFFANHHAVFIGTTKYTLRNNGARFEQPAVFVVEVRDGRVSRHWDFVDYTVGPVATDGG